MKTTQLIIKALLIISMCSCGGNKTKEINDNDSIQTTTHSKLNKSEEIDVSKNDVESTKETLDINTTNGKDII